MLYSEYLENKRDYQEEGAIFLLEKKHCCLFYKPGKGKTYPCIDAIREVNNMKNGKAKVLILSTADAIKNMWNAEIAPQKILPEHTIMMSLNAAIQDKTKLSTPEMILEKNPVIEWFGKIILIIKTTIKKKKIYSIYITSFYKVLTTSR